MPDQDVYALYQQAKAAGDFYGLFGLTKAASLDDIKKAAASFRIKNHPDRKKTEEDKIKFKEVMEFANKAVEVLTDEKKRKVYDTYGIKGIENLENGISNGPNFKGTDTGTTSGQRVYEESGHDYFLNLAKKKREQAGQTEKKDDGKSFSEIERKRDRKRDRPVFDDGGNSNDNTGFSEIAEKTGQVAEKFNDAVQAGVIVSHDDIAEFKQALLKFADALDRASDQQKKNKGTGYGNK